MSASDQNSKLPFLRNEFFKNFQGSFYDDVINRDESNLW